MVNIENDRFPYEEKYFDLIIGLDTLEHLGNFKNMLKECDRVLRKRWISFLLLLCREAGMLLMTLRILIFIPECFG